jgi:hypothetical protein
LAWSGQANDTSEYHAGRCTRDAQKKCFFLGRIGKAKPKTTTRAAALVVAGG